MIKQNSNHQMDRIIVWNQLKMMVLMIRYRHDTLLLLDIIVIIVY